MERLGVAFTVACPAFPANGRSVYQGHLFVGADAALRQPDEGPSADADAGFQPRARAAAPDETPVGLVPFQTVEKGAAAVRAAFAALAKDGPAIGVADAITDEHLRVLGEAFAEADAADRRLRHRARPAREFPQGRPAGAGLGRRGLRRARGPCGDPGRELLGRDARAGEGGHRRAAYEAFIIDPVALAEGRLSAVDILAWATPRLGAAPVLISSTAEPADVQGRAGPLWPRRSGR